MKKPKKVEPICPLIKEPCIEDNCCWWAKMERRNVATGVIEPYGVCAQVAQIGVLCENSMAMNRMSTVMTEMRNEHSNVAKCVTAVVAGVIDESQKTISRRIDSGVGPLQLGES